MNVKRNNPCCSPLLLALLCFMLAGCGGRDLPKIVSQFDPKNGYVPDDATAIAITEAVCSPFYGKELVKAERPYRAHLENDIWTVKGTLHGGDHIAGGSLVVEISRKDGAVLSMTHGQ